MLILKKEYTKNAHKVEISVSSSSPEILLPVCWHNHKYFLCIKKDF